MENKCKGDRIVGIFWIIEGEYFKGEWGCSILTYELFEDFVKLYFNDKR